MIPREKHFRERTDVAAKIELALTALSFSCLLFFVPKNVETLNFDLSTPGHIFEGSSCLFLQNYRCDHSKKLFSFFVCPFVLRFIFSFFSIRQVKESRWTFWSSKFNALWNFVTFLELVELVTLLCTWTHSPAFANATRIGASTGMLYEHSRHNITAILIALPYRAW